MTKNATQHRAGPRRAATMALWILLAAMVAASQPAQAGDLDDVEIWAATQSFAAVETWNVSFTPSNTVPPGGWVRVVFPEGFETSADGPTECEFRSPATVTNGTTFVVSDTEILCKLEGEELLPANVRVRINVTSMLNPAQIGTVGPFLVATYSSDGRQIDVDESTVVDILPDLRLLAGLSVTAPTAATGEVEDWTFRFMPQRNISANASFRVVFPDGFVAQQSEDRCTVQTHDGTQETVLRDHDGARVSCHLGPLELEGNRTVTIVVPDVRNPTTAGTVGPFDVSLRGQNGTILGTHQTLREPIVPHAFEAGPTHASTNVTAGVTADHTFAFTLFNNVAADGGLRIAFPSNYTVDVDGGTTVANASGFDGGFRVTGLDAPNTTLLLERDGTGTATPNGTAVNITVMGVLNPSLSGVTEPFLVETLNATGGVHDAGTVEAPSILPDPNATDLGPPDGLDGPPFGLGNNTTVGPSPGGDANASNPDDRETPGAGLLAVVVAALVAVAAVRRRDA